jgi:hypothetical protein
MEDRPSFAHVIALVACGMCFFLVISYVFKIPLYERKVLVPESNITIKHRLHVADDLFSSVFFPIMAYLAFSGSIELWNEGTIEARWLETTYTSYLFIMMYVARMILHIPVQTILLWDDSKGLLGQMTAHHILSALCFGKGLLTQHMHFWGLFAGCCEFTTGCLAILCISMNCFPPGHPIASIVTAMMGSVLWLGFLVFRICLFPLWLWLFYMDIAADPDHTWALMSVTERVSYPLVVIMIFYLSCTWMWPITKGLLKVLGFTTEVEAPPAPDEPDTPATPPPAAAQDLKRRNSYASPMVKSRYADLPVIRGTKSRDSYSSVPLSLKTEYDSMGNSTSINEVKEYA